MLGVVVGGDGDDGGSNDNNNCDNTDIDRQYNMCIMWYRLASAVLALAIGQDVMRQEMYCKMAMMMVMIMILMFMCQRPYCQDAAFLCRCFLFPLLILPAEGFIAHPAFLLPNPKP